MAPSHAAEKASAALRPQVTRSCFPPERSIHQRPDYVNTREKFGDWEGDLMIFERAKGNANIASLVERKTRFAVLFCNNDRPFHCSTCRTERQIG